MSNIVKNTTFIGLLDLLAPHSCRGCGRTGAPLCDCCKKYIISHHQNFCPQCGRLNPTGNCPNCPNLPPTFIVDTRSSLIGELAHDFKYFSIRALALPLALILDQILPLSSNKTILVPLPTINKHIRERGFSHTLLVAQKLSKLHPNYQTQKLLLRAQNTVQVGADKATRLTQAQHAYTLNPKISIDPQATYVLFDDIWTTGASFQAAYSILRQAGIKNILLLALARSV